MAAFSQWLMMRLIRKIYSDTSTIGELYFKDKFTCYTLEDTVRRLKIPTRTAIPAGRYEVIINDSQRFGRKLPLLLNVPFYSGVRIHVGNKPEDTDGCILVGKILMKDFIGKSRQALDELMPMLTTELSHGKVYLDILGGYSAKEWKNYRSGEPEGVSEQAI